MANRNTVYIDVVVDDKGTTKKVALTQQQAADAMKQLGANAQTTDRQLKGAAQASSNTTKNFSKMAQGISGGLVPAYATLAAQLFAISAAFQFLKDAGNLQTLQAGQVAYAAATGIAMRTLTNDIIAATEAQISFQDAASAASIGVAAGLSTDQMTKLGKAAKDTSVILGRDVTDSFNRLVRGVTKAEPELLDELGIILRLKDATENYKRALGIEGELSSYQRSQAVTAEVLGQVEEKYSKIIDIIDPGVNKFNKLGKAFDDIIIEIKGFVAVFAGSFADVLIKTPQLAAAGIALLSKGVISAAIPGLNDLSGKLKSTADQAKDSFESATKDLKRFQAATKAAKLFDDDAIKELRDLTALDAKQLLAREGITSGRGGLGMLTSGNIDELTNNQIKGIRRAVKLGEGAYKDMTREVRRDFLRMLDDIELANNASMKKIAVDIDVAGRKGELAFKRLETTAKRAYSGIVAAASFAAKWVGRIFSFAGWIGLIFTLYEVAKGFLGVQEEVSETEKEFDRLQSKLQSLTSDYEKFAQVQEVLLKDGAELTSVYSSFGNLVGALGTGDFVLSAQALSKEFKNFGDQIKETTQNAAELGDMAASALSPKMMLETRGASAIVGAGLFENSAKAAKEAKMSFGDYIKTLDEDSPVRNFAKLLTQQNDAWKLNDNVLAKSSKTANAYFALVKQVVDGDGGFEALADEKFVQNLLQQRDAFLAVSKEVGPYTKQLNDFKNSFKDYINTLAPTKPAEDLLSQIQTIRTAIAAIKEDQQDGKLPEEYQTQLTALEAQETVLNNILSRENAREKTAEELKRKRIDAARGASKAEKQVLDSQNKSQDITTNINNLIQDNLDILALSAAKEKNELLPTEKQRYELNELIVETLRAQQRAQDDLTKSIQVQNKLKDIEKDKNYDITEARIEAMKATDGLVGAEKSLADIAARRSNFSIQLAAANETIAALTDKQGKLSEGLTDDDQDRLDKAEQQVRLLKVENDLLDTQTRLVKEQEAVRKLGQAQQVRAVKLATRNLILSAGLTAGQKRRADQAAKVADLENSIFELRERDALLTKQINDANRVGTQLKEEELALNQANRQQLEAELAILRQMDTAMEQYRLAIASGFESGLQKAINDLITGAEGSFTDALLNVVKSVYTSLANKLAERFTDSIIDAISQTSIGSKIFGGLTLQGKIAAGHQQGAATVKTAIDGSAATFATTLNTSFTTGGQTLAAAISTACQMCVCKDENMPREAGDGIVQTVGNQVNDARDAAATAEEAGTKIAEPLEKAVEGVNEALNTESTFTSTIKEVFTSFGSSVRKFGGQLFDFIRSFGGTLTKFLSSFISGLSGAGAGAGNFLATIGSAVMSIFTGGAAANGGIAMGGIRAYASGGIVSAPTIGLVGEGKYNEAIVPLPDGKAIPVDLGKNAMGGGQNNNVVVNVSMNSDGSSQTQTQQADGDQAGRLGNFIAKAVQQELQNQKRSGGILNPYGAA
jgi:hypothetical protein